MIRLPKRKRYAVFLIQCKKSGKDSIIHEAGIKRNTASRNSFDLLCQLGSRLHLSDPAAAVKEDAAFDMLRFRTSKVWEEQNAEICAAKTIYALSLIHGGVPEEEQRRMLAKANLDKAVKAIREKPAFKRMAADLGPRGLADAICKGSDVLTLAYANAEAKIASPDAKVNKKQASMTAQQEHDYWLAGGDPSKKAALKTQVPVA